MKTLILLLIMTSVCWGDYTQTIIDNGSCIIKFTEDVENKWLCLNETYIKISCPDGYKLEGILKNRNIDDCIKESKNQIQVKGCSYPLTDAELKCVKE